MAKFTKYLMILIGLLLLFNLFGVETGGATSGLLSVLLSPEDVQSGSADSGSGFLDVVSSGGVQKISFLITAASSIAIAGVVAAVTRGFNVGALIPWTVVPVLLNIGFELVYVYITLKDFSSVAALLVFSPLIVLWVLTVIDWARGVTS